jgi:hypothetical protein
LVVITIKRRLLLEFTTRQRCADPAQSSGGGGALDR